MILVRKNVYKDVCLFENVFKVLKVAFEMCVCVFENSKDCFEVEQGTMNYLPYSNVFPMYFYSFDIVDLPLIW